MSELKSFIVLYDGQFIRAYEESEADKVIYDFEESHKKEVGQLLIEIVKLKEHVKSLILDNYLKDKEIRHQKRKRCLAMAEACMHKRWRNDEGFDYARSTRHMNKWLELAEKFKEGV
jgi:hypothetical protein